MKLVVLELNCPVEHQVERVALDLGCLKAHQVNSVALVLESQTLCTLQTLHPTAHHLQNTGSAQLCLLCSICSQDMTG